MSLVGAVQWFQHSGAPSHSLATRHCNPTLRLSPLVTWSLAASSPHHLALPNVRRRPQGLPAATESRHRPPLPEIVPGPSPPLAPHRPFRCCNLIPSVDSGFMAWAARSTCTVGKLFPRQAFSTSRPNGATQGQAHHERKIGGRGAFVSQIRPGPGHLAQMRARWLGRHGRVPDWANSSDENVVAAARHLQARPFRQNAAQGVWHTIFLDAVDPETE